MDFVRPLKVSPVTEQLLYDVRVFVHCSEMERCALLVRVRTHLRSVLYQKLR